MRISGSPLHINKCLVMSDHGLHRKGVVKVKPQVGQLLNLSGSVYWSKLLNPAGLGNSMPWHLPIHAEGFGMMTSEESLLRNMERLASHRKHPFILHLGILHRSPCSKAIIYVSCRWFRVWIWFPVNGVQETGSISSSLDTWILVLVLRRGPKASLGFCCSTPLEYPAVIWPGKENPHGNIIDKNEYKRIP